MEQKTVDIPVSVAMRETRKRILQVLGNSGLPICISRAVLEMVIADVKIAEDREYQIDVKRMKEAQDGKSD